MFLYIIAIFAIFLPHFLWKNRYIFNTDFIKNFEEDAQIPLLKNGIPFAMQTPGNLIVDSMTKNISNEFLHSKKNRRAFP